MKVFILVIVLAFPVSLLIFGCGYLLAMLLPLSSVQGILLFAIAVVILYLSLNSTRRVIIPQWDLDDDFDDDDFDQSEKIIERPSVKKKKKVGHRGTRKKNQDLPF